MPWRMPWNNCHCELHFATSHPRDFQVPLHYCNMRFVMVLLDGDDGYVGKCNMLKLISHSSTPVARTGHTHINHHQVRIRAVFFHFHPFHNSIVPKRYLSC